MQFERLCIHRPARRTPPIENAPRAEQNAPHPEPRGAFGINISVISQTGIIRTGSSLQETGSDYFFCKRKETFFRKGVINARNQTPETAVNNRFPVFRNGAAFAAKNYPIG